jgi:hypothetical protein
MATTKATRWLLPAINTNELVQKIIECRHAHSGDAGDDKHDGDNDTL